MPDKIAEVLLYKCGDAARRGYLVFTDGTGLSFYCAGERFTDSGARAFGGFVSPVRETKDQQTQAKYYINFYQNTNESSSAVLNVRLTRVHRSNGENVFDEHPCGSGVMYDSGITGMLTGMVFRPEDEAPPRETVPQVQQRKTSERRTSRPTSRSTPNREPAQGVDHDDVPF